MLSTPQILHTTAQPCARLHITVPRDEIQDVMMPGLQSVHEALAAQGLAPAGPWFTHHLRMDDAVFDFEICVPVSGSFQTSGKIQAGEWPSMKIARTIYSGPYEGLSDAWSEFLDWIESQELSPAGDLWERYLSGPESGPDPSGWKTELSKPLND